MRDFISRMINLELGLLSMTAEKIKSIIDDLVRAGEVSQDEGQKLVDEYIARGEKSRRALRDQINEMVLENLDRSGFVTRKEFDELRLEVEMLRRLLRREEMEEVFAGKKGVE